MKINSLMLLLTLVVCSSLHSQPPNNAIFKGGVGDGFTTATNGVTSNTIFLGGIGDGWNNASNSVASNSIFLGGVGDGWSTATNGATSNTIFLGSVGDGWSSATNGAVSNSIFLGSVGDGWSSTTNGALPNSIFNGGIGDGWSSDFRGLGPLPVTLVYFTAYKFAPKVAKVEWSITNAYLFKEFILEKSVDGLVYNPLHTVAYQGATNYNYNDVNPIIGLNYYRLKMINSNLSYTYSPVRTVQFADDKPVLVVYPNPATDFVKVYSSSTITHIQLYNGVGQCVKTYNANSSMYSLKGLPAGMYNIRITTITGTTIQKLLVQ